MARLIKISYAGLTIGLGGDASIVLIDKYRVSSSYTTFSIEFDVVVRNATRATFLTAEAALLAAYRKDDQDLDVELGGTDRHSFTHSGNTGFNSRSNCTKVPDELSTANSAHYRCSVTVQLPADLSGRSGRQSSEVRVDATPAGKKTIRISGTYTALSSNSATAQYAAAADTYCDGVITAVGGGDTFNLLTPKGFTYDDQNKVLRFERVYQEVFFRESTSGADSAALKGAQLNIDRTSPESKSPSGFGARPLEQVRASYSAFVDSDQTTDIKSLYESTVRPLILAELGNFGGGTVVVIRETPSYDPTENMIRAVVEAAVDLSGGIYAGTLQIEDFIRHGVILVPVWTDNPFDRDQYQGPASHVKRVTRFTVSRSSVPERLMIPDLPGFVEMEQTRARATEHVGVHQDGFEVIQATHSFMFERADVGSGGGRNAGRTATGEGIGVDALAGRGL